jgi:hypothetical protein
MSNGRRFKRRRLTKPITIFCSCGAVKRVPALRPGTITRVVVEHEPSCPAVAESNDRLVSKGGTSCR